jgi:hypothetical protein
VQQAAGDADLVHGAVAKRLCSGLQIHPGRFDSAPRLQRNSSKINKLQRNGVDVQCVRFFAPVVESVDTTDLKSVAMQVAYRFESGSGHQILGKNRG